MAEVTYKEFLADLSSPVLLKYEIILSIGIRDLAGLFALLVVSVSNADRYVGVISNVLIVYGFVLAISK